MLLERTFLKDERQCAEDERDLVENTAVASRGQTATTRRSDISGPCAGYRRPDRLGGGRFHPAHGTNGDAAVPGGWCSVATPAVSGRRLARHWVLAVSLFS